MVSLRHHDVTSLTPPLKNPAYATGSDCRPIAYRKDDQEFIKEETRRLWNDDMIKPSNFPRRAEVLVEKNQQSEKRRMVFD